MAEKLKPDGDGAATKDHNVKHIKETIRAVADAVIGLKAERSEINAQITEERAKLKAFGIKMVDFNAMVRLYELEAEDRNESVDAIRLMWEGLGLGGQGDLFPEAAPEEPPADKPKRSRKKAAAGPAPVETSPLSEANQAGLNAGLNSKLRTDNPYPKNSGEHDYWDRGWMGGQRAIAAQMGPNGKNPPEPPMAA